VEGPYSVDSWATELEMIPATPIYICHPIVSEIVLSQKMLSSVSQETLRYNTIIDSNTKINFIQVLIRNLSGKTLTVDVKET
jgi:hypothetical protein